MATVQFRTRKQEFTIEIPAGGNLLWVALDQQVPARYGCTEGTCGKCVCRITEGAENVSPPSELERQRLGPELIQQAGMRLACQVQVHGPCRAEQR